MIDLLHSLTPAFWCILGALLIPFIPSNYKSVFSVCIAVISLLVVSTLSVGHLSKFPFLDTNLIVLRVDLLSKLFGTVFSVSAIAAFIYASYEKKSLDFIAALFYIGSALGVVFAGDLLTLYMFWEVMAVASAVLILSRNTEKSLSSAKRYILVHIVGGLALLFGILLHYHETGSLLFNSFQYTDLATWMILIGFLVNAAAIPFSSWLPDSYPEATIMGTVILSAYTSKTAVYALIRGFPGWSILIWLGAAMAIYGIIYALLENNIRRLLSYSIVNQVGFMLVAVGVGTPLALAGAAAHAFAHIVYKGLLMMAAGTVIHRTGKEKFTELGGLAKSMPWTLGFSIIGAFTISAFPFTSSYVSKSVIMKAVAKAHAVGAWTVLEIAAAAEVVACSLPFIYFIFFGKKLTKTDGDAPLSMKISMTLLASICLVIGFFPELLYERLPQSALVLKKIGGNFSDLYLHYPAKIITKLQMLSFSALIFFLCLPILKRTDKITLDIDWIYRKTSTIFYRGLDILLNNLNTIIDQAVRIRFLKHVSTFFKQAPIKLLFFFVKPFWILRYKSTKQFNAQVRLVRRQLLTNTSPLGYSCAWILFGLLIFQLLSL